MATELASTLASLHRSQVALDAWLGDLRAVDPAAPSLLPDWTVGHVLTHLARNADGHVRMAAGIAMYPHGAEVRTADIEAGAARPWNVLLADVAVSGASATEAYGGVTDWSVPAVTLRGPRPLTSMPLMRQREIEIHRIDLGLGYGFADLPAEYVRRDLAAALLVWQSRQPMGLTTLPTAALALAEHDRLAWLMGRATFDGLAPTTIF